MNEVFGTAFSHRVSIYVPGTQGVSGELSADARADVLNETLRLLGGLYGGATAVEARGAWVASDGTLVIETVTVVTSYTDKRDVAKARIVKRYCEQLRERLGQEAIAVEVNGKLYFV